MATNRADTLDPALLRPGRLDRKIEFPLPSRREKRLIFQTVTSKMNLGPDVDLEDCKLTQRFRFIDLKKKKPLDVSRPDRLSSAEIASIVQAAGLQGTLHSRAGNFLLAQRKTSGTEESLRNIAS
jgi:26S proteasome regulatory subunit T3